MAKFMFLIVSLVMFTSAASYAQFPPRRPFPRPRPQHHHVWHCTAYAEGHGHSLSASAYDEHYNHAYYGAIEACEARYPGHHCHDVHCHIDHH